MKRNTFIICLLAVCASAFSTSINAAPKAPKWAKTVRGAVFNVTAYDSEGNVLKQGNATVTSPTECIGAYELLIGASSVVAKDWTGTEYAVTEVIGADRMYDAVHMKLASAGKNKPAEIAATPAFKDDVLYLIPWSSEKKPEVRPVTVSAVMNTNESMRYYTISGNQGQGLTGSPLFNAEGKLVAIMQDVTEKDTCSFAIDAAYCQNLAVKSAIDMNADALRALSIPISLPDDADQALVYVYMLRGNIDQYSSELERLISKFPDNSDAYLYRGTLRMTGADSTLYEAGVADLDKAVTLADKKDEALFEYSSLIYTTLTAGISTGIDSWSLGKALEQVQEAISINDKPDYRKHEAALLYALKRYDESLACYRKINAGEGASAENWYYTSVALEKAGGSEDEIIACLDSAVNFYGDPLPLSVSPYILERATRKENAGRFRESVIDLGIYEELLGRSNMSVDFFVYREQLEIKAKMFEQAILDIERAALMTPDNAAVRLEQASLYLRVGMAEQASPILLELAKQFPDDPDCQRLAGVCMTRLGKTAEGKVYLQKAVSLGDTVAEQFLNGL